MCAFDLVLMISSVPQNKVIFGQEVTHEMTPLPHENFFDHPNTTMLLFEERAN